MKKFKKALHGYTLLFIFLTVIGFEFINAGWFGLKFSLPTVGVILMINLILTYLKYRKWLKN